MPLMLADVMQRYWGFDTFRPLQEPAMRAVLEGRDSVVVMPTGGGKSLCFQAPAMCLPGLAVVVSPLISLMKDQVDALRTNGIPAAFVNSSQTGAERARKSPTTFAPSESNCCTFRRRSSFKIG